MYILFVLIATKAVIVLVTGAILYKVFAPEFRRPKPQHPMPGVRCVYCHSTPALYHSEEQKWENDELVLVRTYECRECHMPFWRVERVPTVEKTRT